jgi:hypothetical protein
MNLSRQVFFLLLAILIAGPFLVSRWIWLAGTATTTGSYVLKGMGEAGDPMPLDYSIVSFQLGKKTIWFHGLGNLELPAGTPVPVRYRIDDPYDARIDIFIARWGDILVYIGIPLLMLTCIYLHPKILPHKCRLCFSFTRKPFVKIIIP